jgi:hypothetical protein
MENMWGYRLAVQPTEKSFRPSHRASVHGSILHDASYVGVIELVSEEPVLDHLLLACCDPQGSHAISARYALPACLSVQYQSSMQVQRWCPRVPDCYLQTGRVSKWFAWPCVAHVAAAFRY